MEPWTFFVSMATLDTRAQGHLESVPEGTGTYQIQKFIRMDGTTASYSWYFIPIYKSTDLAGFFHMFIVWQVQRYFMIWELEKIPNLERSSTDGIRTHVPKLGIAGMLRVHCYCFLGLTNITLLYPNIYNRFRLAKVEKITE